MTNRADTETQNVPLICEWTIYAQKKLNNPRWFPWKFERAVGGVIMTGATCPLKKNGTPNFRKKDNASKCLVIFPLKD